MARISDLPLAGALAGTETVVLVQDGDTKRAPIGELVDAALQPQIDLAEDWAEGVAPGGPGTKSSKQHADDAAAIAATLGAVGSSYGLNHFRGNVRAWRDAKNHLAALINTRGEFFAFKAVARTLTVLRSLTAEAIGLGTVSLARGSSVSMRRGMRDKAGRAAFAVDKRGRVLIPRLMRRGGGDPYAQIDSALARVGVLESGTAYSLPANVQRLRRAYYDAPGSVKVAAVDVVTAFDTNTTAAVNLIAGAPVSYTMTDPKIRRLGGMWTVRDAVTFPFNLMMRQRNTIAKASDTEGYGGNPQIDLYIDPGVTEIEWKGSGCSYVGVMVDGVLTSADGYLAPTAGISGFGYCAHKLTLAASASPRRVRLLFPKDVSVGNVLVNAGGKLLPVPSTIAPTGYFIGDSITEGSNSTRQFKSWSSRVALMLGLDQWANGGRGGTGWIKAISTGDPLEVRIPYILTMVNGGPPDFCVIADGLNDAQATIGDLDALEAKVLADLQALRAGAPYMPIFVLGPFGAYGGYDLGGLGQVAKQARIFAAAAKVPRCYTVDTSSWWSDTAVYYPWYNPGTDTTHPIDAGHAAIADRAFAAIFPLLRTA